MPQSGSDLREVLTEYLAARKDAGFEYVDADDIRLDLRWDPTPQRIGSNLRELEREGAVEKWSNAPGATYRILLGDTAAAQDGDADE